MKPAHWSRVTSELARSYGISYKDAKFVYDRMRETGGKTPSLRAVARLPTRLPAALWNPPKAGKTPKAEKPAKAGKIAGLPKNVQLAPPPPPRPVAVKVPKRQAAKSGFAQMLKDAGLPVKAVLDTSMGEQVQRSGDVTNQAKLVKYMREGFRQIQRLGGMKQGTKKRVYNVLEKLLGADKAVAAYHSILKQFYGKPPVQPSYSRR